MTYIEEALSFDDVLLVPCESDVLPNDTDTSIQLHSSINLKIPIMSAAMDTVTESSMAIRLAELGGLGVIHKNNTVDFQANEVRRVKDWNSGLSVAAAVGVDWEERTDALINAGVSLICIDTAHGHSKGVRDSVVGMRKKYPNFPIMAGNVVTCEATVNLAEAGADIIKVGVGPSGICTTRVVAGVGVPQFSAIIDCVNSDCGRDIKIIADGGIRHSGDITKAIGAGADAVMIGMLFAGTESSPSKYSEDMKHKSYRGMGSIGAMVKGSKDRYFQSGVESDKLVPEGVEAEVPYVGSLNGVVYQLVGGLRSGMGYVGARTIGDLQARSKFVKITSAGLTESHVHNVVVTEKAQNY